MIYGRASNLFSALDFERNPPSIGNLPAALTINGTTVYPTFRYKGGDAGSALWKPWGYGETLTLQAGTAPTYNNGSPLLGASDDSVKFNGGGYYAAANNTFADITTEDLVIEVVYRNNTVNVGLLSKGDLAFAITTGTNTTKLYLGGTVFVTASTTGWNHVIYFVDKSGSAVGYSNGVAGTAVDVSGVGSLTSAAPLCLGSRPGAGWHFDSNIACLSMWKGASWLDTHLQATVAATRFAQLTGVYPQSARGTYLPTAVTRSSAGYLDKIESDGTTKLYYVGSNWPRVCSRKDSLGTARKGYLSETSAQNVCLQSQTFATTWGPVRVSVPTTSVLCPDGVTRTTNTLHEDNSAATSHYLAAAATVTSAAWVFSVYAKAANRSWIGLITNNGAIGAYFNLATGVAGTQTGNASGIESVGNGWYRCWFAYTATAGTASYIYIAEANADITFSGLDQDSFYIFGAQFELGNYPSTYIPTTTTAVTRSADLLRYKMDDGNMSTVRGSLECNLLFPTQTNADLKYVWSLTGTTNRLANYLNSVNYATFFIGAAETTINATSDILNNAYNKLRSIWGSNDARILVNSAAEGTPDMSVLVPTGLNLLDVGRFYSAGYETNGLISNLKIFSSGKIRQR